MPGYRPRGFVPIRNLGGNVSFQTHRYRLSAANPRRLFPGDPIRMYADGQIRTVNVSGVGSVTQQPILGVIRTLYNSTGRPLTFNQPTAGPTLDGSTAGFADVYDDPDIVFLVNATTSVSASQIGMFVRTTAATANTAAGISGFRVESVDTTASAVSHQWQILGVSPEQRVGLATEEGFEGVSASDIEVKIADHLFRRQRSRVAGGVGP